MPHIVIEVTLQLATEAPLLPTLRRVHRRFADAGYMPIDNMKSRVHVVDEAVAGDGEPHPGPGAQFAVAWLTTNNARSQEDEQAMTDILQSELAHWADAARASLAAGTWVQVCVMFRHVPLASYRKRQWNPPAA